MRTLVNLNLKPLVVGGALGAAMLLSNPAPAARCDGRNEGVMPSCVYTTVRQAWGSGLHRGERAGYSIGNRCDHNVAIELDLKRQEDRIVYVEAGESRQGTSSKTAWITDDGFPIRRGKVGSHIRGFRCCKRYKSRDIRCGD